MEIKRIRHNFINKKGQYDCKEHSVKKTCKLCKPKIIMCSTPKGKHAIWNEQFGINFVVPKEEALTVDEIDGATNQFAMWMEKGYFIKDDGRLPLYAENSQHRSIHPSIKCKCKRCREITYLQGL